MNTFKRLLLISLVGFTLPLFQNCSAPKHSDGSSLSAEGDFFEYPYGKKTQFYVDMRLYKSGNSTSISEFVFAGSVVYPANVNAVRSYSVRIRNMDNTVLCPVQTGTLAAGVTNITFNCVSSSVSTAAKLELTVTTGTTTEVFSRLY